MLFLPKDTNGVKKLIDVIDRTIPPHRALWELKEYFSFFNRTHYETLVLLTYVVYRTHLGEIKLIKI